MATTTGHRLARLGLAGALMLAAVGAMANDPLQSSSA